MKYLARTLLLSSLLLSCKATNPPPAVTTSTSPTASSQHQPAGVTPIEDESGAVFQIAQGVPGDPAVVGCADGQREAFVDGAAFPTLAGCIGEWEGDANLRAPATGAACGDDAGRCAVPADVCATGWHVCGETGAIADLFDRTSAAQCETAGGGRFVAALSHCSTQEGCEYADPKSGSYQCFAQGWCSEPVCCGSDCGQLGACPSGIWEGRTHIPVGTDQGCGSIGSSRARGVLCCK